MRTLIAVMVLALVTGCVSTSGTQTIRDDFRGATVYRMYGNELPGVGGAAGFLLGMEPASVTRVQILAQKVVVDGSAPEYSLMVEYTSPDWLFIREGQSLSLMIDGEPLLLSGDGSMGGREVGREVYQGGVTERAVYGVSLADLRRIAFASEVLVRIDGEQRFWERAMSAQNVQNFADFLAEHGER